MRLIMRLKRGTSFLVPPGAFAYRLYLMPIFITLAKRGAWVEILHLSEIVEA